MTIWSFAQAYGTIRIVPPVRCIFFLIEADRHESVSSRSDLTYINIFDITLNTHCSFAFFTARSLQIVHSVQLSVSSIRSLSPRPKTPELRRAHTINYIFLRRDDGKVASCLFLLEDGGPEHGPPALGRELRGCYP